jgi:hypothetical protein
MKPEHPYGAVALGWVVLFALVSSMCAQEATAPRHTGVPQDWSQHHIVFSRDALARHPDLMYREPRILHQAMQRWQAPNSDVFHGAAVAPRPASANISGQHRDWSVRLAGRLPANMFPAKFSFDASALPDCTNDYVVFGPAVTQTPGVSGVPPNLVAFNNLYVGSLPAGLCGPGPAPTVLFAYNITTVTGGRIRTSPILSLDGTKIAFVESVPANVGLGITAQAIFHVLTWTAGKGTLLAAAVPAAMTSLTYSPTSNNTSSSPWIDYSSDIVYLGADNGKVYKITGVFKGTPTLAGAPWPVLVTKNLHLTSPVLDAGLGVLMVGSTNGTLFQINTSSGALTPLVVGASGQTSPGIVAAPIVDVTNGTTFVVSANDGTSAVLVEADTASNTSLRSVRIGLGSATPAGGTATALSLYEPAFTNNYFNDPSSGDIRLCGTGDADTTPWQYAFGFTGRTMNLNRAGGQQLLTSTLARCTGFTEFFNPNVNGGTDFFFFGLTQDCTAPGTGFADGCVVARSSDTTITKATVNGGPSGIVVDNFSTAGQAANIYLSADKVNTVYKFSQFGLQ